MAEWTDADVKSMAAALYAAKRDCTFRQALVDLRHGDPDQFIDYRRMALAALDHLDYCPSKRWAGAD